MEENCLVNNMKNFINCLRYSGRLIFERCIYSTEAVVYVVSKPADIGQ